MKSDEGIRHWTPKQADAVRERLVVLLVRVLPLQAMSPLQQLGVGCDQHGAVCDRRRRNDAIRRIKIETRLQAGERSRSAILIASASRSASP